MAIPQLSEHDIELLREFDTPTVCNVIELFQVRPQNAGYMDGRIRCCFSGLPPMVGYASTATFRAAAAPRQAGEYGSLEDQVKLFDEIPEPAVVVFQDLDDPAVAATFGEVMTTIYHSFGAAGLITSGAARDLDQVRAFQFPCFSNGVICSHGYPQILDLHVPVQVGGVLVCPGDLLHGDVNGVTTIPHEIASEAAHACEEFVQTEEVILDYCRGGKVTPEGLAKVRKEQISLVQKLKARIRK